MTGDNIDPVCGQPWSEHTRSGDCPQSDDYRWPRRLLLLGFLIVVALLVWVVIGP